MNWGKGIVLAFIIFIAFIMYMVIKTVQQDIDLISDDYYAQELKYQDVIEAEKNTLPFRDSIHLTASGNSLQLKLPTAISREAVGEIYFFRPSDIALDKKIPMALDTSGIQIISTQQFASGMYIVKLNWQQGGKFYFFQHTIMI